MALRAYLAAHPSKFAPAVNHTCTRQCTFWEHRDKRAPAYVCVNSLAVHPCGENCKQYVVTEEFEVCRLTGRVVNTLAAVHHWAYKRPGTVQTHSMPKKHTSRATTKADRIGNAARAAVVALFMSSARNTCIARDRSRLARVAAATLRKSRAMAQWYRPVAGMALALGNRVRPATTDYKTVHALAAAVASYVVKFADDLKTTDAARAMAAAVVDRMTMGHVVSGVVMIPKIPFVVAHAPHPLDHAELLPVRCRAVSLASRLLSDRIVTNAGGPLSHMAFELPHRHAGHGLVPTRT